MKDMDKAVERVERAVRNREKIMVYGDYDVDGTTAVALVYKFLRQIGHKDLLFYIPDRYTEGYGISTKGHRPRRTQGCDADHRPGLWHQSHRESGLCQTQGRGFHHLRPSPPGRGNSPRRSRSRPQTRRLFLSVRRTVGGAAWDSKQCRPTARKTEFRSSKSSRCSTCWPSASPRTSFLWWMKTGF